MSKIIAICNQKGGCGKSTLTENLGAALTSCGAKVLLVDLDPSGNPESFSALGFQDDYSAQEWAYLDELCEKLVLSRYGERYQGAKLAQWMNG